MGDSWVLLSDPWAFLEDPLILEAIHGKVSRVPMGDPFVSMGDSRGDPGTFLGESWAPRGDQGATGVAYESYGWTLGGFCLEKVLKWPWKANESHLRPYNAPKRFL